MTEKRNIVLITLDSLRADHCSFMGYHRKTTPTIDKMARKGLYFENAIASGVPTGPSMFGVFTGEYCPISSNDFFGEKWREEYKCRTTLAEALRACGYITGAFHANPYVSKYFGVSKGFHHFYDFVGKTGINALVGKSKISGVLCSIKKIIFRKETNIIWEKYYNLIVNWVRNATKRNKYFFLWILLLDTHTPYIPPRKFKHWSNISNLKLIYLFWKLQRNKWKLDNINEQLLKNIIDAYDDEIRYADRFIRVLSDDLKDCDPIIIIHADHGDGFGEHGFLQHPPMLYEELTHVPLVIYNADINGKVENPVSLLSVAPTILELIGEENVFPSESLLNNEKEYVISKIISAGKKKIAVRTNECKYIVGQKDEEELYNLRKDPTEQINLVNDHPDIVKEMREIVKKHIKYESELNNIRDRIRRLGGKL